MGLAPFMRYASVATLVHQSALVLLVTFSFAQPSVMLLKVVSGTLLTTLCIWGVEVAKK